MGKAIGIDLGTTNSVMAIKRRETEIIKNDRGDSTTRSAVSFYRNQLIVGSPAIDVMASAYRDTVISIKRLMGRAFSDPDVQEVKKRCTYEIKAPENGTEEDIRIVIGGKEYSPIEISAMILKKMKTDAEDKGRLGQTVDQAVITVPAYFVEKQRNATRVAGLMAGLKVQKILDEPTAAAIAFGVDNIGTDEVKTILVYDLGGGTFDVSLLTIAGGTFAQLNIEGDMWLGGDDFDNLIMDYVVDQVKKENSINPNENLRFLVELKKQAEKAKIALSSMNSTEIMVTGLLRDKEDNLIDVIISLSRSEFEKMIQPQIEKSIQLVKKAIKGADLSNDMVDHILLVGGSSQIPMVYRALADNFGEDKILKNVDPMTCVAQGAAILAQRLEGKVECPSGHTNSVDNETCTECGAPLIIVEVGGITPKPLGIGTAGNKYEIIIEKGAPYPSQQPCEKTFYTPEDNMRRIRVPVYAGFNSVASENEPQVTAWLELPSGVKKGTEVIVAFSLDDDGVLNKVTVRLKDGSGREVTVFPDRGDDWRCKVEQKLNKLREKRLSHSDELDTGQEEQFEKLYSQTIEAANKADEANAEKKLQDLEKLMHSVGKKNDGPVAEAELQSRIMDVILSNFGYAMDPQKIYQIKRMVEKAKQAAEDGDEKQCLELAEALETERKGLDVPLPLLIDRFICARVADDNGQKGLADKIYAKLQEFRNYFESQMYDKCNSVIQQIDELAEQVNFDVPTENKEELLSSNKS